MTSLNPVMRVGAQIEEAIRAHEPGLSNSDARNRVQDALRKAAVPEPEERAAQYPHQLSGGLRQRVMIAMALAAGPKLLIADEPTTALDVTVQKQILELLKQLQRDLKLGLLFITHDLGVVAQIADRVAVMYAGRIVEEGPTREVLRAPRHPYTQGLLAASPKLERGKLTPIAGSVPQLTALPPGCAFEPRCGFRKTGMHARRSCASPSEPRTFRPMHPGLMFDRAASRFQSEQKRLPDFSRSLVNEWTRTRTAVRIPCRGYCGRRGCGGSVEPAEGWPGMRLQALHKQFAEIHVVEHVVGRGAEISF